jgi:hypothetical protein
VKALEWLAAMAVDKDLEILISCINIEVYNFEEEFWCLREQ